MNNAFKLEHMSFEEILAITLEDFAKELGVNEISTASDIAIKSKVFASQLEGIYYNQEFLLKQSNPATATGIFLDIWGVALNVDKRNIATPSIGTLTFGRKEPYDTDLGIPKGTIVSTDEVIYGHLINAITDEDAVLKAGETEVDVSATTEQVGAYTNVSSQSFNILTTPPTGIEYAINNHSFIDGSDRETDESYRERFHREKFWGTEDAFARRAREIDGVIYARTLENNRGPGTTDVLIASASGVPSDELLEKTLEHLLKKRPICCDLGAIKPSPRVFDIKVKVELENGYTLESVVEGAALEEVIKRNLTQYLLDVGIGGVVRVMGIADSLYHVEGIKDILPVEPHVNTILKFTEVAQAGDIDVSVI